MLLDASRLIDEDGPVAGGGTLPGRRRGLISSDDDTVSSGDSDGSDAPATGAAEPAASAPVAQRAPKAGGGATLFERMANLSRGGRSSSDDDDDDDAEGPSISIPRFLGRQNNQ